jgi:peptide/nickel transport system ATP-binding protein
VVRHVADVIAVMYLGMVVEAGPTEDIWNMPLHPYTKALIGAVPQLGEGAAAPSGLPGDVPDPADPPSGCRFHPRCPAVLDRCSTDEPVWDEVATGRFTECWLHTGEQPVRITSAGDAS